jgi:type I site-specific restriction endonuclease
LAHEDIQKKEKYEEHHFDEILMRCDEELNLLGEFLRELELYGGITVNDGKCSQVPSGEELPIASKETKMIFGCTTNYVFADTKRDDEHEAVIREIESMLFPKNEILLHFQQEYRVQEIVLKDNHKNEGTKDIQHIAEGVCDSEVNENFITLMKEGVQQQLKSSSRKFQPRSSGIYQQEDKLDKEIDEIWMLIMKVPKRRHTEVRRTVSSRVQLSVQVYVSKENGVL